MAGTEKRKKKGTAAAANEAEIRGPSLNVEGNLRGTNVMISGTKKSFTRFLANQCEILNQPGPMLGSQEQKSFMRFLANRCKILNQPGPILCSREIKKLDAIFGKYNCKI
jgi:hypothetical protein